MEVLNNGSIKFMNISKLCQFIFKPTCKYFVYCGNSAECDDDRVCPHIPPGRHKGNEPDTTADEGK